MSCLCRKQHNRRVHLAGDNGRTLCGYNVRLDGLDLEVTCPRCDQIANPAVRTPAPHGWRVGMPWQRHPLSGV